MIYKVVMGNITMYILFFSLSHLNQKKKKKKKKKKTPPKKKKKKHPHSSTYWTVIDKRMKKKAYLVQEQEGTNMYVWPGKNKRKTYNQWVSQKKKKNILKYFHSNIENEYLCMKLSKRTYDEANNGSSLRIIHWDISYFYHLMSS